MERMADWIDVAKVEEFPAGTSLTVDLESAVVAVFNVEGEFYAIEDLCTHDGGDLASGDLEGDEIVCPRHGARFNVRTGEVLSPPAYEDVRAFQVRVEAGMVQVKDETVDS
jgi:3-phenylpropionate/trans-cinnamate dioxygenase ferredoxin component